MTTGQSFRTKLHQLIGVAITAGSSLASRLKPIRPLLGIEGFHNGCSLNRHGGQIIEVELKGIDPCAIPFLGIDPLDQRIWVGWRHRIKTHAGGVTRFNCSRKADPERTATSSAMDLLRVRLQVWTLGGLLQQQPAGAWSAVRSQPVRSTSASRNRSRC